MKHIFLSHVLNASTPSYGGRESLALTRMTDIGRGDPLTGSRIGMSVHLGTHVDLPAHFHGNGQTIEAFPAGFWWFEKPCCMEITPRDAVVRDELIDLLESVEGEDYDLLLVKTGLGSVRKEERYWRENAGFHPDVCEVVRRRMPRVRVMGFDTISVSSFLNRPVGREAHWKFLDPAAPILLLEDMDLSELGPHTPLAWVMVAPLLLEGAEALPCTVVGAIRD